LITERGYKPGDELYLIGRYTFDIQRIKNFRKQFKINHRDNSLEYIVPGGDYKGQSVRMEFITAHRAKGLEAPYTIVINCNSGKMGFPSEKADDPLLNLLLSSADQFENGEERRLFYVAITRTKNHVILLADKSRKSKFIKELQKESGDTESRCPKCKEGELILRTVKANYMKFYGCSNFAYGCDYTAKYIKEDAAVEEEVAEQGPVAQSFIESKGSMTGDSSLSPSEKNKLNAFIAKPESYAFSEKGREKVRYLLSIQEKYSPNEVVELQAAITRWESKLNRVGQR
jgi:ATP-dependent exoDNAse (exonuclease V) beta subunit